jgi:hypothetical protein
MRQADIQASFATSVAAAAKKLSGGVARERVLTANDHMTSVLRALLLPADIGAAAQVCTVWRDVCESDELWQDACRRSQFDLLQAVQARDACTLSWKQLWVQRAMAERRATTDAAAPVSPALRTEYEISVDVFGSIGGVRQCVYASGMKELTKLGAQTGAQLADIATADGDHLPVFDTPPGPDICATVTLRRKQDGAIFSLVEEGHVEDDYGDEATWINFYISGTGQDVGIFKLSRVELCVMLQYAEGPHQPGDERYPGSVENVSVQLDDNSWDEQMVPSVDVFLQMLTSPAFASRWVHRAQRLQTSSYEYEYEAPGREQEEDSLLSGALKKLRQYSLVQSFSRSQEARRLKLLSNWEKLQACPKLLSAVLLHLGGKDLRNASGVSKRWFAAAFDESAWEQRCQQRYPSVLKVAAVNPSDAGRRCQLLSTKKESYLQRALATKRSSASMPPPLTGKEGYMVGVELKWSFIIHKTRCVSFL